MPYLYKSTLSKLCHNYFLNKSFFSLVTGYQKNPYTLVIRNNEKEIIEIKEKRKNNYNINYGERDIGIFLFDKKLIGILKNNKKIDKIDKKSEHNFLYIIKYIKLNNLKISNINITNNKEFISFNSKKDLI